MIEQSGYILRKGILLFLVLAALFTVTGTAAAAGTIIIDTDGLTGTVGELIQIPVKVTDPNNLSGYQLHINTGNRDDATILFDNVSTGNKPHSNDTGTIIWYEKLYGGNWVTTDSTIFYLNVTPISGDAIPLTLSVVEIYEGTASMPILPTYTGQGATLSVARSYTITPSVTGNGTINPAEQVTVAEGESQTFDTTPDTGHYLADILIDGTSVGNDSASHTFENVDADHTITAVFAPNTYTIIATADNNGTISPAGDISVTYGESQTFTIQPDDGYKIEDVRVDEASVGNVSAYTFGNIDADHTIDATFTEILYTITATPATGGSIAPAGEQTYAPGETPEYTITPDIGYKIADVRVDDVSVGSGSTYTFPSLTGDHTISAEFAVLTYTITATSGANGSITPPGITTITYGGSQTYTIQADTGYEIADVTVDGTAQQIAETYTFENVVADHTISISFSKIIYDVTVSGQITNGTVTADKTTAGYGDTITLTNTADIGYTFGSYRVTNQSGGEVTVTGSSFIMPAESVTVSAEFILPVWTITASHGPNGTITPSGSVTVDNMSSQTFTIRADTGYEIADLTVDGAAQPIAETHTFENVVADHTISTNFSKIIYNVIVSGQITNGTVTADKTTAGYGDTVTLTATPNTGYELVGYTVTGASGEVTVTGNTFTMPAEDVTVSAEFILPVRTITAVSGTNGSIDPTGAVSVNNMSSQTFTITPDANYRISDLTVDGTVQPIAGTYTFENVVTDHTISANFTLITHTITATAGANGTIDPAGEIVAANASSKTFTIQADTGYKIADLTVDGTAQQIADTYTFTNVVTDHTISTNFSKILYTVTISDQITNGTVSADKPTAGYGDTVTLTNTADIGYTFGSYRVTNQSGGEVIVTGSSFTMPAEDVTVTGTFIALPLPTVIRPDVATVDIPVTLHATYPGADTTYTWNIGGTITTETTGIISHTFTTAGDYPVTVNATNRSGTSADISFSITVRPAKDEPADPVSLDPVEQTPEGTGSVRILQGTFDSSDVDADDTQLNIRDLTTDARITQYSGLIPALRALHSIFDISLENPLADDPHNLNRLALIEITIPGTSVTDPNAVRAYRITETGKLELLKSIYLGTSGGNHRYIAYAPGFSVIIFSEETSSYVPPAPVPVVDNGGADDGLELLAQAGVNKPTPTATPVTPTVSPTVPVQTTVPAATATPAPTGTVPTPTQTATPQPSKTQAPLPVAGLLLGMGAAALLLRRSR